MRALVIGMGSIGQRHAKNLAARGFEVLAYDPFLTDEQRDKIETENKAVGWVASVEAGLFREPSAALVCTPPNLHHYDALRCIDARVRTFVEKPLCPTHRQALHLVESAEANGVTLACGYMLRSLPRLWMIKRYMPEALGGNLTSAYIFCHWKRTEKSYAWPGVLEETSHELDIGCWLFGRCTELTRTALDEDIAVIEARHDGCPRVVYYLQSNSEDYFRGVTIFNKEGLQFGATYGAEDIQPCYNDELGKFLIDAPVCTGRDALPSLALLEVAREASEESA